MKQNIIVEGDILFYKEHLVWHMIDRADRWHAGVEITNKQADTLCEAMMTTWYQISGPYQPLVIDGEMGLNSDVFRA